MTSRFCLTDLVRHYATADGGIEYVVTDLTCVYTYPDSSIIIVLLEDKDIVQHMSAGNLIDQIDTDTGIAIGPFCTSTIGKVTHIGFALATKYQGESSVAAFISNGERATAALEKVRQGLLHPDDQFLMDQSLDA